MAYSDPKDSSTADLLRLIAEDRAESAPPQAKEAHMTHPHPALEVLMMPRWDAAFSWLLGKSFGLIGAETAADLRALVGDLRLIFEEIPELVDTLYEKGTADAGELALAWSMLTCSPRRPASFRTVLPQLQTALDNAGLVEDCEYRERLRLWWRAARGDFAKARQNLSMHCLAEMAVKRGTIHETAKDLPQTPAEAAAKQNWVRTPFAGPTMIVMPRETASKLNNYNRPFEAILGKQMPVVLARNLAEAQRRLAYEFPHAEASMQALSRDVRDGEPLRLRPTILVGPPGAGKSRLVRKFAAAAGWQRVHRFDGASSADGHFAGTSKGWSNTEASVPARAVLASKTANPLVFIDEIDKAATNHHGSLWTSLLGFLEPETARAYRDQSTDCEFDLSMVSYLCTANDVSGLPSHLRDRFRIVKVPAPRLVDLPLLAGSIVDDMLRDGDEWAGCAAPFAPDELMVMAKAWESRGMSMRALQKIVAATLEARDAHAMRH